jgi:rsbT co-antagonist protein RsbR
MSEDTMVERSSVASELRRAMSDMLGALQAIARGELDRAVSTNFPDSHPVGALAAAINDVSEALDNSRRERERSGRELEARIELIERQRQAIVEMSTPVIEVWTGVLTLPVVGTVDSERASKMTIELLDSVVALKASLVILDVTGMDVVDTAVADHFLRMARAVRLLGAECVLSGVRPQVASTIVQMGFDVGAIQSFSTLRAALQHSTRELAKRRRFYTGK